MFQYRHPYREYILYQTDLSPFPQDVILNVWQGSGQGPPKNLAAPWSIAMGTNPSRLTQKDPWLEPHRIRTCSSNTSLESMFLLLMHSRRHTRNISVRHVPPQAVCTTEYRRRFKETTEAERKAKNSHINGIIDSRVYFGWTGVFFFDRPSDLGHNGETCSAPPE